MTSQPCTTLLAGSFPRRSNSVVFLSIGNCRVIACMARPPTGSGDRAYWRLAGRRSRAAAAPEWQSCSSCTCSYVPQTFSVLQKTAKQVYLGSKLEGEAGQEQRQSGSHASLGKRLPHAAAGTFRKRKVALRMPAVTCITHPLFRLKLCTCST